MQGSGWTARGNGNLLPWLTCKVKGDVSPGLRCPTELSLHVSQGGEVPIGYININVPSIATTQQHASPHTAGSDHTREPKWLWSLPKNEVIEIKDDRYNVYYDFSGDAWVGKDQVFLYKPPSSSELVPGTKVFVGLESGSKWAPGRIKENRKGQFLVQLNNKYQCGSQKYQHWATVEELILRK